MSGKRNELLKFTWKFIEAFKTLQILMNVKISMSFRLCLLHHEVASSQILDLLNLRTITVFTISVRLLRKSRIELELAFTVSISSCNFHGMGTLIHWHQCPVTLFQFNTYFTISVFPFWRSITNRCRFINLSIGLAAKNPPERFSKMSIWGTIQKRITNTVQEWNGRK